MTILNSRNDSLHHEAKSLRTAHDPGRRSSLNLIYLSVFKFASAAFCVDDIKSRVRVISEDNTETHVLLNNLVFLFVYCS